MVVEESVIQAIESVAGDAVPAGVGDWQAEQSAAARGIVEGDVRYLPLPDKFEFHEYRQMEQFIGSVADTQISARLWNAIKGKGAFRHFKDTAARLGVLDDWFAYRDKAAKRFMLDWAAARRKRNSRTP